MTKRDAESQFREFHMPGLKAREAQGNGIVDKPGRRMEWNDFTDMLQKSGQITRNQSETWAQPRWLCSSRI